MRKKNQFKQIFIGCAVILVSVAVAFAQKNAAVKPKQVIFAVLNGGQMLEPVAVLEKGRLTSATGGDSDIKTLTNFTRTYYKPKTAYKMIFGGANAGTITINSSDPKADCAPHTARISPQSAKANLRGFVMALATDLPVNKNASGLRRMPTAGERTEIESLVRAEFARNKVGATALKNLGSHNLTALDVDNDGIAELVGTYWVETSPASRALLFFIADKSKDGKYVFGQSEFRTVKQDEVMSGEIKMLDQGIYHELLLDVFDYDGDGTGEIFTYIQSFEGSSFNVYKRKAGKWVITFAGSNYHCAY